MRKMLAVALIVVPGVFMLSASSVMAQGKQEIVMVTSIVIVQLQPMM